MTFGLLVPPLELSEYPINFLDKFSHNGGTTTRNYSEFSGYDLVVAQDPAEFIRLDRTINLPSISVNGTTVTVSGGDIKTNVYVFIQ